MQRDGAKSLQYEAIKMKFDYFDMLSGQPIPVPGIGKLRSPKLSEINPYDGIGHNTYLLFLNYLSWSKDSLIESLKASGSRSAEKLLRVSDGLTAFDVATLHPKIISIYNEIFEFFLDNDVEWSDENKEFLVFDVGENVPIGEIKKENFEEVRTLILQMNYIGLNDKETLPAIHTSKTAKELWERVQEHLKQQASKPSSEKTEYSLGNIISKLCSAHPSYNLLNVQNLTIFQVYDAFFQLGFLRSTELGERIYSIHGGDKFKFEDWLKPIIKY